MPPPEARPGGSIGMGKKYRAANRAENGELARPRAGQPSHLPKRSIASELALRLSPLLPAALANQADCNFEAVRFK